MDLEQMNSMELVLKRSSFQALFRREFKKC